VNVPSASGLPFAAHAPAAQAVGVGVIKNVAADAHNAMTQMRRGVESLLVMWSSVTSRSCAAKADR
jgi:hypothetical protein